jgi:hypothetical protein
MKPYHLVFTTINQPLVLNSLYENVSRYGHLETVKIWVIGDRKTPDSCRFLSESISARGLEICYLDIAQQDDWGRQCPSFYSRIPYNNETRRNIGYLCALADQCRIMISIDDDNYPIDDDFIGQHAVTGQIWDGQLLSEETGFHNVCEYLELNPSRQIYPRGYPFRMRGLVNRPQLVVPDRQVRIGVTAGLWLKDPDIDATTWLNGAVSVQGYTGDPLQVLSPLTWMPINTQNTSIVRELIPAFLCIPMGWPVPGGTIQRYGDIWGGFFLQAIMQGTEYVAAFGLPLVEHRRNPHDYIDDLRYEFWGLVLTDWLLAFLRSNFSPVSDDIADRVDELAVFLENQAIPALPEWCPPEVQAFFHWTAGNLKSWSEACRCFL